MYIAGCISGINQTKYIILYQGVLGDKIALYKGMTFIFDVPDSLLKPLNKGVSGDS